MPRGSREERLAKINERRAKLDQAARKLQASLNRDERKKDTRGKVLLGVVMLDILKKYPDRVGWFMREIRTSLQKSSDLAFLKDQYDFDLSTKPITSPAPSETPGSRPS